jgi:hypothetical protein
VTLEVEIENRHEPSNGDASNVVADLPGTDARGEFVMIGAHLDSLHGGTGATDNAAGVAVMLEVIRILQATGLPLRRSVRIGLWTGEEQGLLGSRAYVKEYLADRETMELKGDHALLSAYYNLDNGTGAIRGIYAEHNGAVLRFGRWMATLAGAGVCRLQQQNAQHRSSAIRSGRHPGVSVHPGSDRLSHAHPSYER